MSTKYKDLPPGRQLSTSDLSDPPEFTDDEMSEIVVNMAPITRQQSGNALIDDDDDDQHQHQHHHQQHHHPEINLNEASKKPFGDTESSSNDGDDTIVAEIHVSPNVTRRRVPSKRSQLTSSRPTSSRQPAAKRPKTSTKKWEPNYVTQNSRSPLVGRDLRALLLHPLAWEPLTEDDKKEVLALFPDDKHILDAGTPDARPNVISLQNDDNFRHDTEEYVSNLSRDMHDPAWLQDAWAAHGSRAAGNFDQYYVRRLEADWKTTIPDEMKPEHLRLAPPADQDQGLLVAGQPAEGEGGDTTTVATGADGPAITEDGAKGNDSMEIEEAREVSNDDLSRGSAEDGVPENIVVGTETASGAKDSDTNGGDSDNMRTGSE